MITAPVRLAVTLSLVSAGFLAGCASTQQDPSTSNEAHPFQTEFAVDKSELSSRGTNTYFILEPGYRSTFRGKEGSKQVELVITVLDRTETVDGVETRVVEERESVGGALVEVSRNFFAISKRTGDVYYFGEDVDMYEGGKISSHAGAWRSGVDGAKFGLMMPGDIALGRRFYQEIAPKVAMDRCEIVAVDAKAVTPAGRFERCVKMEETTPVEPGDKGYKLYAPGVGLIKDGGLELASHGTFR